LSRFAFVLRLRPAELDDAEAIRAIYNLEVETSTATFDLVPRSLEAQREWLSARSGAFAAIVADDDGAVVGFTAISPYKERAAYRTTVEDAVYVHRAHHGRGIGKLLLSEMIVVANVHGFHAMIARIERTNEASVKLHEACGFTIIGTEIEVGRKFNRWLDVTLMQRMLGGPENGHERPQRDRS
jgi:L-amino acid N-acyltransferase YncA